LQLKSDLSNTKKC